MVLDFCIWAVSNSSARVGERRHFVKYLAVVCFSFLLASLWLLVVQAQTPQPVPPAIAAQQSIARVNGDRDLVETALRHYEESVVLNDQGRQAEIAALTDQVQWWKDCTSEKIAGCRQWLMTMSPTK
jgi:hypothetical protein